MKKPRIAHIEGMTDEGIEFVDSHITAVMVVPDAGRIIIRLGSLPLLEERATEAGLTISYVDWIESALKRLED